MPFNRSASTELRLTRRGWGAVVVIVVAVVFAWLFGERALNAAAAPAAVALLAGLGQVLLADDPAVERIAPTSGFPGESREVTLDVTGGTTVVDLLEDAPRGLRPDRTEFSVATPGTATYHLTYAERGAHSLGPTTAIVRDVFGLVARRYPIEETDEVIVYPAVYVLDEHEELSGLLRESTTAERQEFDALREYVPGDPMRDIHWKSSAKRPDELIVREFHGREPEGTIKIATAANTSNVDEMASATASIVLALTKRGITVDVALPETELRVGPEQSDRRRLLEALARTGPGQAETDVMEDADVTISGNYGRASVSISGRTTNFKQWRRGRVESPSTAAEEVA